MISICLKVWQSAAFDQNFCHLVPVLSSAACFQPSCWGRKMPSSGSFFSSQIVNNVCWITSFTVEYACVRKKNTPISHATLSLGGLFTTHRVKEEEEMPLQHSFCNESPNHHLIPWRVHGFANASQQTRLPKYSRSIKMCYVTEGKNTDDDEKRLPALEPFHRLFLPGVRCAAVKNAWLTWNSTNTLRNTAENLNIVGMKSCFLESVEQTSTKKKTINI